MFTFRKTVFLGIDFGMSHIKAVELTVKDNQIHLSNYGEISTGASVILDDKTEVKNPDDKAAVLLKALLQKMGSKSEAAFVSMPGFSGLITLIELPNMEREEMEKAVRFEAQRYVPAPINEVVLSWDVAITTDSEVPVGIIDEHSQNAPPEPSSLEVLLVAALKKEVEKYELFVRESGLQMELLELETFSLVRSLARGESGASLIIDIGFRSTNLVLVDNGAIKVNRNVSTGGYEITTTLAESMGVSRDRAETLKQSGKDILVAKESSLAFPSLELVIVEAKRMIAAYVERHRDAKVDRIILSGGASKMKGMDEFFTKAIGVSSKRGDPWKSVIYDERLQKSVEHLSVSYSVAIGLALAGVETYERK